RPAGLDPGGIGRSLCCQPTMGSSPARESGHKDRFGLRRRSSRAIPVRLVRARGAKRAGASPACRGTGVRPPALDHTTSPCTRQAPGVLKEVLLAAQLARQRLVDLPFPGLVGVVPQTIVAMPLIVPPREIHNRVETDA